MPEMAVAMAHHVPGAGGAFSEFVMRIISWVSGAYALLIGCASGASVPAESPDGIDVASTPKAESQRQNPAVETASVLPSQVVDIARTDGAPVKALLQTDRYTRPDTGVEVKIIAALENSLVIVDTYLSVAGGGSYCQAGQESFLRVLRIDGSQPQETLRIKLASCWQEIELAEPGLEWLASDSSLQIHWLFGPTFKMKPEELTLRLSK